MEKAEMKYGASVVRVMKCPVVSILDGVETEFESGEKLYEEFQKTFINSMKYTEYYIREICLRDGKVVVSLTSELVDHEARNNQFIEEHIRRYGRAPDLFDGD